MRKISNTGIELCKYQADFFEASVNYLDCSSSFFYKQFSNSNLAKRMDKISFLLESKDVYAALDELKAEKNLSVGTKKESLKVMAWVGYLIRYWSFTYEIPTRRIHKIIKLEELSRLYEAYHSLDVEEAIKRISESKNIKYFGIHEDEIYILKENFKF